MENKIELILKSPKYQTIRLIKNISVSLGVKGISMFISLFTMPAYIRFFDNQVVLGMWFTAISMLSWILTFDLGIGNGLRNYLVKPITENNSLEIKKYISSSYISIGIVITIIIFLSNFIIPAINWNEVFNISNELVSNETMLFMVRTLFIGIMINFILKLVISIFYALQKPALPSILSLITSIIMLVYVSITKNNDIETNIKSLATMNAIATNLPLFIASIIVFTTKLKYSKPSIKFYSISYSFKVLKLGGIFFLIQIMSMIMYATNEFFISWLVNPEEVVNFQVYNKIFMLISTLFNLALTPVWSEVREAQVKKDFEWINKLYKKLNKLLLILVPCQMLTVIFFQPIVNIWLGNNNIEINFIYAVLYAIYSILHIKVSIDSSIISGLGKLNIQLISLTTTIIIKLILMVYIVNVSGSWIAIIVANIISLIPYIIIEYFDINSQISNN